MELNVNIDCFTTVRLKIPASYRSQACDLAGTDVDARLLPELLVSLMVVLTGYLELF